MSTEGSMDVDPIWHTVENDYELLSVAGEGSFGKVYKAKHKSTGRLVAIKFLDNVFKDEFTARKMLREISIMRQFSQISGNHFTTKLYDVITPEI
jgi:serine/threonine protein kinase